MTQGKYSFVCKAGCGVCFVRLKPFEYSRTETLEGDLLESLTSAEVVSSCCGSSVGIYDNHGDVLLDGCVELSGSTRD